MQKTGEQLTAEMNDARSSDGCVPTSTLSPEKSRPPRIGSGPRSSSTPHPVPLLFPQANYPRTPRRAGSSPSRIFGDRCSQWLVGLTLANSRTSRGRYLIGSPLTCKWSFGEGALGAGHRSPRSCSRSLPRCFPIMMPQYFPSRMASDG